MIRKFIFAFVLTFTGLCCHAEGYNILGVSYTNTFYHSTTITPGTSTGLLSKGAG